MAVFNKLTIMSDCSTDCLHYVDDYIRECSTDYPQQADE
jgi:hypothetical protein